MTRMERRTTIQAAKQRAADQRKKKEAIRRAEQMADDAEAEAALQAATARLDCAPSDMPTEAARARKYLDDIMLPRNGKSGRESTRVKAAHSKQDAADSEAATGLLEGRMKRINAAEARKVVLVSELSPLAAID
jgi:hypothetical protein